MAAERLICVLGNDITHQQNVTVQEIRQPINLLFREFLRQLVVVFLQERLSEGHPRNLVKVTKFILPKVLTLPEWDSGVQSGFPSLKTN